MIHELYRVLNVVAIALLCLVLGSIQSVLLKAPMLHWLELDMFLLIAIYLSLSRSFMEGALVVIIIGRIAEIHSGSPVGLLMTCYLTVFTAILLTKEFFLVGTSFSAIILATTGGVIWKLAFLLMSQRYGIFDNLWRSSLEYSIPFLLSLGLFVRPVFFLMRHIDQWTKSSLDTSSDSLSGEEL